MAARVRGNPNPSWPFFCACDTGGGMYLLYVDESGDPGPAGSRFLILGEAPLFEGKWLPVEHDLRSLISRYFPAGPKPSEIHLAELRKGKKEFRLLSPAQRGSLLQEFCQLARSLLSSELVMFSVIADKPDWFAALICSCGAGMPKAHRARESSSPTRTSPRCPKRSRPTSESTNAVDTVGTFSTTLSRRCFFWHRMSPQESNLRTSRRTRFGDWSQPMTIALAASSRRSSIASRSIRESTRENGTA